MEIEYLPYDQEEYNKIMYGKDFFDNYDGSGTTTQSERTSSKETMTDPNTVSILDANGQETALPREVTRPFIDPEETMEHKQLPQRIITRPWEVTDPLEKTDKGVGEKTAPPREITRPFIVLERDDKVGADSQNTDADNHEADMLPIAATGKIESAVCDNKILPTSYSLTVGQQELLSDAMNSSYGTDNPLSTQIQSVLARQIKELMKSQLKGNADVYEKRQTKEPKITTYSIMQQFLAKIPVLIIHDEIYLFSGTYYRHISIEDARAIMLSFCHEIIGDSVTTRITNEVLGLLTSYESIKDNDAVVDDSLIAARNCLYNIRTGAFIAPSYKQRCFHFLPHNLDLRFVDEQFCPRFSGFLSQITSGNSALIRRLWELTAILLTPLRIKNLLVLFGPPSSGKSVFISLIKKLLVQGDCFPLTFARLTDRFSLYYAAKANVITYPDIPNKRLSAKETAMLKSLCSTEDDIAVEGKGKEITSLSSSRLKILLASNFPLRGYTYDEAFDERLTYFIFPNSTPKESRIEHLSDILAGEADAIISTALLKYLPNLLNSNCKFSGELETQELFDKLTSYLPENEDESLINFIDDCIIDSPDSKVSTAELFTRYTKYCNGYPMYPSDRKFSEALFKALKDRVKKCRVMVNGNSVNGYKDIMLKP